MAKPLSQLFFTDAADLVMERLGASTFSTVQHMQDIFHSTGWSSGGGLTDAGGGTVDVAAGTGFIRGTNDPTSVLFYFDWPTVNLAIPADTIRYIGVEYNAGTPQAVARASDVWDLQTEFPLGSVVNEAGVLCIEFSQQAVGDHAGAMIQRMLETQFIRRDSRGGGLTLGESGTRNVTLSSGALWKRLNRSLVPALDTSVSGSFESYYQDGAGDFVKAVGLTQWPNDSWDDNSGTLQPFTAGYYGVLWFYLKLDGTLIMVYGRGEYASLQDAEGETAPATLPIRVEAHSTLIGRFIFQEGAASVAEIQGVFEEVFSSSPVSDHNLLNNLTVGDPHTQYQLNSVKGLPNGYASLDGGGLVPEAQLPPTALGGSGFIRVTDVTAIGAGESTSNKTWQDPVGQTILQQVTSSTADIRVHLEASYPVVDVDGNPATLGKSGGIYVGTVDITIAGAGDVVAALTDPDGGAGAEDTVNVQLDLPPVLTALSFTGTYPGSQSELKENDNFDIAVTADKNFDQVEVLDYEAGKAEIIPVAPTSSTTVSITIADRGDLSVARPARVRVRDANTGAFSATRDTNELGGTTDAVDLVFVNDAGITVSFGAKTYPGVQEAIKELDQASVAVTVSANGGLAAADTVNWTSPPGELTITNPSETGPTFDSPKLCDWLSGDYNISSNNLRATCNRAANDKTTQFNTNIAVVNVAPTITVTEPAARLRSGGNDGTSEQLYTITINSDQQLLAGSSPSVDPESGGTRGTRGVFQGSWTGGPTSWTRSLGVHDDDGKGTYTWANLAGVTGKSGLLPSGISGNDTYVLGGFVARSLTFAAFATQTSMDVEVVDFSKLTAGIFTATNNPALKQAIGTSPPVTDGYTIDSLAVKPTQVIWLDTTAAGSNSGGTAQITDVEETV